MFCERPSQALPAAARGPRAAASQWQAAQLLQAAVQGRARHLEQGEATPKQFLHPEQQVQNPDQGATTELLGQRHLSLSVPVPKAFISIPWAACRAQSWTQELPKQGEAPSGGL